MTQVCTSPPNTAFICVIGWDPGNQGGCPPPCGVAGGLAACMCMHMHAYACM